MSLELWILSFAAPAALAQPALRFSLAPGALALSDCVAQPGNVPVPLSPTNTNLEIVDWVAAPMTTNHIGEFTIRFRSPIAAGTVIGYEPGLTSFRISNEWRTVASPNPDRKLQVNPFPAGVGVEAIRFSIPAQLVSDIGAAPPRYRATLNFITVIPLRMENIATAASVSVSSVGSQNDPSSVIDGEVNRVRNFVMARRAAPNTPESREWVALTWPEPVSFRGLMLLHGASDPDFGRALFDSFTGDGTPAPASGTNQWQPMLTRSTQPGAFRRNRVFVSMQPVRTRGLRLSCLAEAGQLGLGEVLVLAEAGSNPMLAKRRSGERVWMIPRVPAGQITVDGDDRDWPDGRTIGFALAFDDQRLYLTYTVRGDAAPFTNQGTNVDELFHTGDAIDLMLQTRTDADASRREAGLGDIRLIFSVLNGQPACVLYDYRVDDLLVVPVIYKSGGREVSCERVSVLKEADVQIRRERGRLTVEAGVPLAAIHLDPHALKSTRGDIGRITHGAVTPARHTRWANRSINEIADVAEAAGLRPHLWGTFRFEQAR